MGGDVVKSWRWQLCGICALLLSISTQACVDSGGNLISPGQINVSGILTDNATVVGSPGPMGASWNITASATETSEQTIQTATWTNLVLSSENFDTAGLHSVSTNTSDMVIPAGESGYYLIVVQATFAANANGMRALLVLLNGATLFTQAGSPVSSASARGYLNAAGYGYLSAGDYLRARVYQTSGGPLVLDNTSGNVARFDIVRIY